MPIKKSISRRILTLDLLRGWFLIVILLDHLQFYPNGFDLITGKGSLYVSAAEGFFLISGIVLGVVRGRKLIDKPFHVPAMLLIKRGMQLYITTTVLFFIFTLIGWHFMDNPGLKPGVRPIDENMWEIIKGALTFKYIYGWADFLRLYTIYLFISPFVIWLLRKGAWYLVVIGSFLMWSVYDSIGIKPTELSMVFGWQTMFFGGMIIGFYIDQIREWWQRLGKRLRQTISFSIVSITIITAVANFVLITYGKNILGADTASAITSYLNPLFSKFSIPLPRIVLSLIWFAGGFWLFHRFEKFIIRFFGWILLPFGTNSLYVYTIEAFVLFFIHLLYPPYHFHNILINFGLSVACIMVVWLAVHYRFLAKIIPK